MGTSTVNNLNPANLHFPPSEDRIIVTSAILFNRLKLSENDDMGSKFVHYVVPVSKMFINIFISES